MYTLYSKSAELTIAMKKKAGYNMGRHMLNGSPSIFIIAENELYPKTPVIICAASSVVFTVHRPFAWCAWCGPFLWTVSIRFFKNIH